MSMTHTSPLRRAGQIMRTAALMVVAGIWRTKSLDDIEAAVIRQSGPVQVSIVLAVLAGLFVTALLFAQAGWIGILIYWLGLILVVR